MNGGRDHTCAVRTDGSLWCWGDNFYGQLGQGNRTNRPAPTRVGADTGWAVVSLGANRSCALRGDQSLWCWGSNVYGELGLGAQAGAWVSVPTRVSG